MKEYIIIVYYKGLGQVFKCRKCGAIFTTRYAIEDHLKIYHGISDRSSNNFNKRNRRFRKKINSPLFN